MIPGGGKCISITEPGVSSQVTAGPPTSTPTPPPCRAREELDAEERTEQEAGVPVAHGHCNGAS